MTNQTRKIHLKEFKSISRAISTYDDIPLLATHMAEHMCRAFEVKGCSIMLFDEREKQLFRVSSCGVSDEYLQKGPVFIDEKYTAFLESIRSAYDHKPPFKSARGSNPYGRLS